MDRFTGRDVLTEEQMVDLSVCIAFLDVAQRKLATLYLTMDTVEFDGIYDDKEENKPVQMAREEITDTIRQAERACYRFTKKLQYAMDKEYDG